MKMTQGQKRARGPMEGRQVEVRNTFNAAQV